jgi:RimJ/RimL family protein N-acetyltransferase
MRLLMLQESPTSFGSDVEQARALTVSDVEQRVSHQPDNFIVGAFTSNTLVGVTGGVRESAAKRQHIAFIWGVYVVAEHRGHGLSRRMLDAALNQMRTLDGIERVQLAVTAGNSPAQATYLAAGFTPYGTEPAALRVDGQDHDEIMMQRLL